MIEANSVLSTPPLNTSSFQEPIHRQKPFPNPLIRFPINPLSDSPTAKPSPVTLLSRLRGYPVATRLPALPLFSSYFRSPLI
jgi:hypothetical protein